MVCSSFERDHRRSVSRLRNREEARLDVRVLAWALAPICSAASRVDASNVLAMQAGRKLVGNCARGYDHIHAVCQGDGLEILFPLRLQWASLRNRIIRLRQFMKRSAESVARGKRVHRHDAGCIPSGQL